MEPRVLEREARLGLVPPDQFAARRTAGFVRKRPEAALDPSAEVLRVGSRVRVGGAALSVLAGARIRSVTSGRDEVVDGWLGVAVVPPVQQEVAEFGQGVAEGGRLPVEDAGDPRGRRGGEEDVVRLVVAVDEAAT